ncbi:phage antirepressor [Parabacteroides distasonis]|jgi:anti-repressor protein|uniref:phage antirepressor n=1 Tax=Parabacteroides distasonis TaxID=823 RepID=UPI000E36CE14|nr:phage antirepressor [Parabacteroides distasonis]REC35569.1 phage antirepressor Ant [Parabacteroides distasonis]UWD65257.1 MAG: antirepressor protein KilAC domain [Bacteriophage sp.]UWG10284.1 MAG: antirepressor protein KilAC domain [Bacteriophage sp.]
MEAIKIFENDRFGEVRVAGTSENPLFCLADVCKILGLRVDAVQSRLTDAPIRIGVTDSIGREQQMNFVNEKNLYKVIMRSDKPQAEPFQDWVCGEVLPSIRKHGAYMTNDTLEKALASPDFLIQLATNLKEEQRKRIEAERKVTEAAPAVAFTNAVQSANSSCLIGELAKLIAQNGYSIGEKRLFAWMRDNGYLGKHGERYNIPNQQYVEQGLFELKKGVRSGNNGVLHTTITPKVTGKGQVYFVNKFLGNKEAC